MSKKKRFSKKQKRKIELGIVVFVTVLSIVLWNSYLIYPIKLFVILIHEMSHAVAAVLTGGTVASLAIKTNLSGDVSINGGVPIIIAFAGYLGSSITGAFLFLASYNKRIRRFVGIIIGSLIIIITINLIADYFTVVFALTASLVLIFSSKIFNEKFNFYFLRIIGLISSIYALIDIKEDTLNSGLVISDAQILASLSGINPLIWGFSWFLISLVILFFLFRESYKKGF